MTDSNPNILLIVMDTARSDWVLGMDEIMPNIHTIASEGTTFKNAFSAAPWTLPSHASLFTGEYTSSHRTYADSKMFSPDSAPLAKILRAANYETAGFSNNAWISDEFGFTTGFEEFRTGMKLVKNGDDIIPIAKEKGSFTEKTKSVLKHSLSKGGYRSLLNAIYAKFFRKRYDSGALLTNRRIKRWLTNRQRPDRPFFVFINYLEPHLEYDPPHRWKRKYLNKRERQIAKSVDQDPWKYICGRTEITEEEFEALRSLYKTELSYLDYRIGNIYDYLEESGKIDETILVIVGDHGENIGDHGLMDHQYCLYDTLLHVPLIVRYPEEFPEGEQFEGLIEHRDIFSTLTEAAGNDRHSDHKKTLQELMIEDGRKYVLSEYLHPQPSINSLKRKVGKVPEDVQEYGRPLRAIRTQRWKLIESSDRDIELYDIKNDPEEQKNVASDHPKVVEDFQSTLAKKLDTFSISTNSSKNEISGSTKERLEQMGYLQ